MGSSCDCRRVVLRSGVVGLRGIWGGHSASAEAHAVLHGDCSSACGASRSDTAALLEMSSTL